MYRCLYWLRPQWRGSKSCLLQAAPETSWTPKTETEATMVWQVTQEGSRCPHQVAWCMLLSNNYVHVYAWYSIWWLTFMEQSCMKMNLVSFPGSFSFFCCCKQKWKSSTLQLLLLTILLLFHFLYCTECKLKTKKNTNKQERPGGRLWITGFTHCILNISRLSCIHHLIK